MRTARDIRPAVVVPPSIHQSRARNGFVVIFVLFWTALFAFAAMRITLTGRTEMRIAANARGSAMAEAAADGAVNTAIFELLARTWNADGTIHAVRTEEAVTQVRVTDEAAKVDPNVAPQVLMQMLLEACGAVPPAATKLAAAIAEWRSLDLLQSVGSEKAPPYGAAGLGYIPPHKRFVSNDELGLVLGMTPALLACLDPRISIYSLSVPSLQTASDPLVRQALRNAYPDDAPLPPAAAPEAAVVRIIAGRSAEGAGQRHQRCIARGTGDVAAVH
ncbi:MAG TPA: hypothetical protein VE690_10655, partial [Rhodopila sp.]|nr:hypothetical protein [Rhodopila sp.]